MVEILFIHKTIQTFYLFTFFPPTGKEPVKYEEAFKKSWVYDELYHVRNVRPSFHSKFGLYGGLVYTGLFCWLFRGKEPWTLSHGGM